MPQSTIDHSFRFTACFIHSSSGSIHLYGLQLPERWNMREFVDRARFHLILRYRRPDGQILAIVDFYAIEKVTHKKAKIAVGALLGLHPSHVLDLETFDSYQAYVINDQLLPFIERAYLDMGCE